MSAEDALYRVIAPMAQALFAHRLKDGEPPNVEAVAREALAAFEQAIDLGDLKQSLMRRIVTLLQERQARA
jgi:hypothetical protein